MVHFTTTLIGAAAVFARYSSAIPVPDSSVGDEVAVSAPNGVILSDTAALASQLATDVVSSSMDSSVMSSMDATTTYDMGSAYTSTATMDDSATMTDLATSTSAYYSMITSSVYDTSYDSSSSMVYDTSYDSSSSIVYDTSMDSSTDSMVYDTSYDSATSVLYTATTSAYVSTNTMSYGSGSSNWGGSGYDSCVQQCMASYGAPMGTYTPPTASSTYGSGDSSYGSGSSTDDGSDSGSGSGVTHTVIVAPTQGVLRYVPFATNASVGDTVKFIWGANVHTVTKSSQLELCNKTSDAPFASGSQNQSFVFTQVVNDTNPIFFYCGTPTHCEKGMFGIINPPTAEFPNTPTAVDSMMTTMAANSSDMAAMWSYANNMTMGSPAASSWGGSMDMAQIPTWAQESFAENVLYTRTVMAANPNIINSDGSINLGDTTSPLMVPQDLSVALSASSSSVAVPASTPTAASGALASASAAASSAAASSPAKNGARSLASSSVAVGIIACVAAFFAL